MILWRGLAEDWCKQYPCRSANARLLRWPVLLWWTIGHTNFWKWESSKSFSMGPHRSKSGAWVVWWSWGRIQCLLSSHTKRERSLEYWGNVPYFGLLSIIWLRGKYLPGFIVTKSPSSWITLLHWKWYVSCHGNMMVIFAMGPCTIIKVLCLHFFCPTTKQICTS